jgi:predicted secreted protein
MSSKFEIFKDAISKMMADDTFRALVSGNVLGPITTDKEKESVVLAALRCILGGPQGVRTMEETKNFTHIKNNKNWRPFCQQLLDYLKEKNMDKEAESFSSMFASFKKFWPECDAELQAAVADALKKK